MLRNLIYQISWFFFGRPRFRGACSLGETSLGAVSYTLQISRTVIAVRLDIAVCALVNKSTFFRTYCMNVFDFQSPMFRMSPSVNPAAANVVAPPIRREWEDIRAGASTALRSMGV